MNEILISTYFILLFISSILFFVSYKSKKRLSMMLVFSLTVIFYYLFIPLISLLYIELSSEELTKSLMMINHASLEEHMEALAYIIVTLIIIFISLFNSKEDASHKENLTQPVIQKLFSIVTFNRSVIVGIFLLVVSIVSELIIIDNFGGVLDTLSHAELLRWGAIDNATLIPPSKLPTLLLMVSSLGSTYFLLLAKRTKTKKTSNIILNLFIIMSIITSVFYLLLSAGRLGILLFLIPLIIDFSFRHFKKPKLLILLFTPLIFLILGPLDNLFYYISYGIVPESTSGLGNIITEFSFPYMNLLNVSKINELFGLRYGLDFITWMINIVPTTILNIFGLTSVA